MSCCNSFNPPLVLLSIVTGQNCRFATESQNVGFDVSIRAVFLNGMTLDTPASFGPADVVLELKN